MAVVIEVKDEKIMIPHDWSDEKILMDYRIEDLFYGHHSGLPLDGVGSIFRPAGHSAYFLYIIRVIKYLYVAIYMDWTIIFRHPVNFFLLVTFFSVSIGLLFSAGIFLSILSIYRCFCPKQSNPVIESWMGVSSKTEDDLRNDLIEGMKLLGNHKEETRPLDYNLIIKNEKKTGALGEKGNLKRISKLKALLFFSTLVYKRETEITPIIQGCVRKLKSKLTYDDKDDQKVYKYVYEKLDRCDRKHEKEKGNEKYYNNNSYNNSIEDNINILNNNISNNIINNIYNFISYTSNINDHLYTFENIENKIRNMVGKDEEVIKEQIKDFDLNFTSISELNTSDGGSFCGMFWSEKENFIIVSFKGTTPTNFAEWLGNLTFQCVDARNYLFGQVHRGFYSYLFPIDEESAGKNYPCQKIIDAINCKATTLKNKNGKKVNLWITGHSLGGALATLFYARLLNINYSHESWELQGAVTFASPAVGDINFATQLASLINDPRNLAKPLWRIVLNDDMVPKMPYRACNKRMRKYGYHYNVLMNYAQVGDKVTFYGGDRDPTSIKEFFNNENVTDNNIDEHVNRLKSYCKQYCKEKKFTFYSNFGFRHGSSKYFKTFIDYEKKISKK